MSEAVKKLFDEWCLNHPYESFTKVHLRVFGEKVWVEVRRDFANKLTKFIENKDNWICESNEYDTSIMIGLDDLRRWKEKECES